MEVKKQRLDSDSSPDLGDMWKYGCPKGPVWSGDGFEWAGSDGTSSLEYYEHTVDNLAIEVFGQNCSSDVISVFLEDWEVGRVAPSCHLSMDLLWVLLAPCVRSAKVVLRLNCDSSKAFLSPWTGCDNKGDAARQMKEKERERRALVSFVGWPVSFNF